MENTEAPIASYTAIYVNGNRQLTVTSEGDNVVVRRYDGRLIGTKVYNQEDMGLLMESMSVARANGYVWVNIP